MKVVTVFGPTGVGKSDVAIEIATKFNGEVISADSIQLYKGLSIASNAVSKEEAEGIPHHLIGCLEPSNAQTFNVRLFVEMAKQLIIDITERGKLPVICGGTLYYIMSLLFGSFSPETIQEKAVSVSKQDSETAYEVGAAILLIAQALKKIDPERAQTVHPKDTRKVMRSLEVAQMSGQKHSDVLANQKMSLQYDSLFIWVDCESEVLFPRCDKRIDGMVEKGILGEVTTLYQKLKGENGDVSPEIGVMQAIGFKEFLPYLQGSKNSETLMKCLENLKTHTKQYVRKQRSWINNKLLSQDNVKCIKVMTSDVASWDRNVSAHLDTCVKAHIKDEPFPSSATIVQLKKNKQEQEDYLHTCDNCGVTVLGTKSWQLHLSSRRHKKRRRSLNKEGRKHQKKRRSEDNQTEENYKPMSS